MKVYVLCFHGELQADQPAFLSEGEAERYINMTGLKGVYIVPLPVKRMKDRPIPERTQNP